MQGMLIGVRIDSHGLDAKLPAGSHDPDGDLTAIGNQNLFEHGYKTCWIK
jgi:hypothetical protein